MRSIVLTLFRERRFPNKRIASPEPESMPLPDEVRERFGCESRRAKDMAKLPGDDAWALIIRKTKPNF